MKTQIKKINGVRFKVIRESLSYSGGARGVIEKISEEFVVIEEMPDIFYRASNGDLVNIKSNAAKWSGVSKPSKNIAKKITNGPYQEVQGNVRYTYTPVKGYKKYRSNGRIEDCVLAHTKRDVACG